MGKANTRSVQVHPSQAYETYSRQGWTWKVLKHYWDSAKENRFRTWARVKCLVIGPDPGEQIIRDCYATDIPGYQWGWQD